MAVVLHSVGNSGAEDLVLGAGDGQRAVFLAREEAAIGDFSVGHGKPSFVGLLNLRPRFAVVNRKIFIDMRPQAIHEHALDNLRYIRETMERAGSFTTIPGWGGVAIGATAVIASLFAARFAAADGATWARIWLAESVVAALIALVTMWRKGRRASVDFASKPARRFFVSYFAPITSAALLTLLLIRANLFAALPALWLLMYGASFVSSGAFSIRVIPIMGICFMILGAAAAFVALPIGNVLMGAGFGALHIIFGFIIARSYGG